MSTIRYVALEHISISFSARVALSFPSDGHSNDLPQNVFLHQDMHMNAFNAWQKQYWIMFIFKQHALSTIFLSNDLGSPVIYPEICPCWDVKIKEADNFVESNNSRPILILFKHSPWYPSITGPQPDKLCIFFWTFDDVYQSSFVIIVFINLNKVCRLSNQNWTSFSLERRRLTI